VSRVLVSKDRKGVLKLPLPDLAVGGEVSTGRIVLNKVMLFEEALGTGVVSSGEVNLSEEKGIIGIIYSKSAYRLRRYRLLPTGDS